MIDLGSRKVKLYFIKLADKTVLKVKLPTRAMILNIVDMLEADMLRNDQALDELYSFMLEVFNRNINGLTFTMEDMENMFDIETALYVLKDYLEYSFAKMGE